MGFTNVFFQWAPFLYQAEKSYTFCMAFWSWYLSWWAKFWCSKPVIFRFLIVLLLNVISKPFALTLVFFGMELITVYCVNLADWFHVSIRIVILNLSQLKWFENILYRYPNGDENFVENKALLDYSKLSEGSESVKPSSMAVSEFHFLLLIGNKVQVW